MKLTPVCNLSFKKRAVYAIYADGSYKKYETIKQASVDNNVSVAILNDRLDLHKDLNTAGVIYRYADELELVSKISSTSVFSLVTFEKISFSSIFSK